MSQIFVGYAGLHRGVQHKMWHIVTVVVWLLSDCCSVGTHVQVMKSMPPAEESRKRKADTAPSYGKKSKTDPPVLTAPCLSFFLVVLYSC